MSSEEAELLLQAVLYNNEELLRDLLGANESSSSFNQPDGNSILHVAAVKGFTGCLRALLDAKCDVDVVSGLQSALKTPLLFAAENGHSEAVEVLINAGADLFTCDANGHSALQLAQMGNHDNTVKVLISSLERIQEASVTFRKDLCEACVDGDCATVYRILAEMPKQSRQQIMNGNSTDDKSALYLACEHGRTDVVQALLTVSGHIIIFSPTGDNVLHAAVASQNVETVAVVLRKFPFLMDASNNERSLPLHWACRCGSIGVVKLMLATEYPEDELKFFEDCRGIQTYKYICDLNATDNECRTPFYLAVANGHTQLVYCLLNFKTELFRTGEEPSIGSPLALNIYCSNGRTALMTACANANDEVVRMLLDYDVDVNLPIALTESEVSQLRPMEEVRCAGSGALVEAAKTGNVQLVRILLRKGALDYDNRALAMAVANKKQDEISLFLNQLSFADAEYRVNRRMPLDAISTSGTGVLNSSNLLLANIFPSTPVQLNWHGATLETIAAEWIVSAALKFNARLRHSRLAFAAITRLDLSNNRLPEIPLLVYQLQSLHVLDLSQNLIQKIDLPSAEFSSPCLETFNLEANFITALPAVLFSKTFPSLKTLNVAGNRLRLVPPVIWSAPKLKELNLANNEVVEICSVSSPTAEGRYRKSARETHRERIESRASRTRDRAAAKAKSPPPKDNRVIEEDITRINAWQSKVQLSNIDDLDADDAAEQPADVFCNSLRTLNLAGNKLESIPDCLACCCPKLTRLDLSMNVISAVGPIECLPSALRHLNLSHNRLTKTFQRPELHHLFCQAPSATVDVRQRAPGGNRHSRSRSRSVARNQRSLSVVRGVEGESGSVTQVCPHKSHARFEALRTLNLSYNQLTKLDFFVAFGAKNDFSVHDQLSLKDNSQQLRSYIAFPALTNLDVSYNSLRSVPPTVSLLSYLAALNVAGNSDLDSLPDELGLVDKLWNVTLKDCPMKEPLRSVVCNDNYKTVDLIAFLRNRLENSKSYKQLKLVILGGPGVGKTQLLQQMRNEGVVSKRNLQSESWSRRMGHSPSRSSVKALSQKTIPYLTSSVDVAEWTYEPKKSSKSSTESIGPITFRSWDFDGKVKEYSAVCQYFLTRRSIYLVLWRATDGEIALNEIHEWLLLIQMRAPNATVVIVGTHFDAVEENLSRFPPNYLENLYRTVQERFVCYSDADKKGLPRVAASLFVSLKTKHNIRALCNLVYQAAMELRTFGRKHRLLTQKVPAIFIALERVVVTLTDELRAKGAEPIMTHADFWPIVSTRIVDEFGRPFRDQTEFLQACAFLHDNGILIHFEDIALGDFFFLDPPWLYSAIASAVAPRPNASSPHEHAITLANDLATCVKQFVSHSVADASRRSLLKQCVFRLLSRFEAALPCQNRLLVVPSALPDEYLLRADYPGAKIRIKTKTCGFLLKPKPPVMTVSMSPTRKGLFHRRIVRTLAHRHFGGSIDKEPQYNVSEKAAAAIEKRVFVSSNPKLNLRRLFVMQYIPPGFWARLTTRILDDEKIAQALSRLFLVQSTEGTPVHRRSSQSSSNHGALEHNTTILSQVLDREGFEWLLWKSGLEVDGLGTTLVSLKQFLPLANVRDVNYSMTDLQRKSDDGQWRPFRLEQSALVELLIPAFSAHVHLSDGSEFVLEQDRTVATRLLAILSSLIDDLLEDWFPALGTRFVHTSEGRLLVDRLIPCPECALSERNALRSQKSFEEDIHHGPGLVPRSQTTDNFVVVSRAQLFLFTVEECILQARGLPSVTSPGFVTCPRHELVPVEATAPDVTFSDLSNDLALPEDSIRRGKLMGRGAFGFVFDGFVKVRQHESLSEVALKVLEPVEPGAGVQGSAQTAFEAFMLKWRNDACENCARSYCTARQELNMLADLNHAHVTALVGFCARPMTIAVELAPLGALDKLLAKYRRADCRLSVDSLQTVCVQIAKALEYLHTNRIIYRDLKSENVLVWRFPLPRSLGDVHVKLGDYGISRFSYPAGVCKGYGGTEGFMAPEVMRTNGEQEYTERVDCFSFGMFLYELISLKQPYDGQEQMKDFILDGGRPFLSDKELLVPSNVLDLMVACWAEDPDARPSASQLVSMTAAPEFGHLLDIAVLEGWRGPTAGLGALAALPSEGLSSGTHNSHCWFSRDDAALTVLSCSPFGWLEQRTLRPHETVPVSAVCAVDENTVWMGDARGWVRVFANATLEPLTPFCVAQLDASFAGGAIGIESMHAFPERQLALIVLLHSVLVCTVNGSQPPTFLTSIELAQRIFVSALAPAFGNWQIWTGHEHARLIVHHMNGAKNSLSYSASVSHASPSRMSPPTAAVRFVVTSPVGSSLVWSALDGGSQVFLWDNYVCQKKLDTRKLLPVSESLSSMCVDAIQDGVVSALAVLTYPADQLIVGTSVGLIVVADGRELTPLSSFRPFASAIDLLLPITCQPFPVALGTREPSLQSLTSLTSSSDDSGGVNDYLADAVSRVKSMFASGRTDKPGGGELGSDGYFVAVGRGSRHLLHRFAAPTEEGRTEDSQRCAVVFRASNWSA